MRNERRRKKKSKKGKERCVCVVGFRREWMMFDRFKP
jgi:hypothetical protein